MLADGLLVIDLQKGVVGNNPDIDSFMQQINRRIASYREAGRPIIFIQHNDADLKRASADWQLMPSLDYRTGDPLVEKTHANSFYRTNLLFELNTRAIMQLEICGAQTEFCVDTTVKMAHGLGFELHMQPGFTTTEDNAWMSREETVALYEHIWRDRFVQFGASMIEEA